MLEKLGKKALGAPFIIAIVLCCVIGLAITPLIRAEPNEVPFVVVNEDEGAITIMGESNVGQTMVDAMLSGEGSLLGDDTSESDSSASALGDATITWTQLSSEEEALEALKGTTYYGALIIPQNFTSQQMNALVGLGSAPEIKVYLNEGKNAQMASTMQTMITAGMTESGVSVDAQLVNTAEVGGGMMAPMMMVQMIVMPFMMLCLVSSIILSLLIWRLDILKLRESSDAKALGVQLLIALVFSAFIACLALLIETVGGGMTLPFGEIFLYLWVAGFCVMCFLMGFCDLCFPVGAVLALCVFAFGMGTAMLGQEMLPAFWADLIYPWAPQACMGNGIRAIIYFHTNPYTTTLVPVFIEGVLGLIAFILALVIPARRKRNDGATQE